MFNMNISASDRDVYSLVLALFLVYLLAHSVGKYNTIYMHRAMLFIVEKGANNSLTNLSKGM